jgi:microcompartment protein CcmK/EutM
VVGRLVASRIVPSLEGEKLLLVERIDESGAPVGRPFVACDAIGANAGERVFIAQGREATFPLKNRFNPADNTIVAIIDEME